MRWYLKTALFLLALVNTAAAAGYASAMQDESEEAPATQPQKERPLEYVLLETTMGDILLELNREEAPVTVENFLQYVEDDFYDGTIFHRVISNFMIQGGGMTRDMKKKETREPIRNEWGNDLKNERGTIAMARTSDPDSATAQFFINVVDNRALDQPIPQAGDKGYAVFGGVIAGMDTVDKIKQVPTRSIGGHQNVPVEPVVIKKATRLTPEEAKEKKASLKGDGGASEENDR